MVATAVAVLAGCASAPPQGAGGVPSAARQPAKTTPPRAPSPATPTPAEAASAGSEPTTGEQHAPAAPAPAAETEVARAAGGHAAADTSVPLPRGQFAILVESQPSGATVVVDGIPVGRAPHRVVVAGTSLGYFQSPVSIKVRFVATDTNGTSQTVEEALTARDRIPAALVFTPAGAQRRLR